MKRTRFLLSFALLIFAVSGFNARAKTAGRGVDIKSTDGTILKATYFAAANPGPGVLLFHQSNRTRSSWDDIAKQLAAAGINTLTVDLQRYKEDKGWWAAEDAAFDFLASQPGVNRDIIGIGGAGGLGIERCVETTRRHANQVKSLVLISGETSRPELQFLHQASQLPGLFVFSDDDEYPPEQEAMELIYDTSSSPSKKLIHYSADQSLLHGGEQPAGDARPRPAVDDRLPGGLPQHIVLGWRKCEHLIQLAGEIGRVAGLEGC